MPAGAITISSTDTQLSNAQVRTAVEAATNSNVFTDADHTKLNGIELFATADQTAAEIRTAVEAATDSNVFTDADHTKLNDIETLADVTDATNVAAAGAVMNTGNETIAGEKTFSEKLNANNQVTIKRTTGDFVPFILKNEGSSTQWSANITATGNSFGQRTYIESSATTACVVMFSGGASNTNNKQQPSGADFKVMGDGKTTIEDLTVTKVDVTGESTMAAITADGAVDFSSTLNVGGATTLNGAVTLGNATDDDITVTGYIASHIIPKTKATYDLGTTALGFNDIHLSDGGIIDFSNNDAYITHSAGKLTLNGDWHVTGTTTQINTSEMSAVVINSGTIDGTTIGTTTPSSGAFTSLSASGNLTVTGDLTVNGATTTVNTQKYDSN